MEITMEFPILDSSEKAMGPKELITQKTKFIIKRKTEKPQPHHDGEFCKIASNHDLPPGGLKKTMN